MKRTRLWKYVSFIIMTGIISFTSAPVHAAGMSTECVRSTVKAGKIVWRYMKMDSCIEEVLIWIQESGRLIGN